VAYAVLTRDAEGAAPYAAALAPLGLEAVALAVTRTEPPPDPEALGRAVRAGHDAILVASARGAAALVPVLAGSTAAIWAVGPATAAALGGARVAAEGSDGATVARALLEEHGLPLRVLVPRAEGGRDEAIAILGAAGAEVTEVVVYRTVAIALTGREPGLALLTAGTAEVCVVFAPSQVAALAAFAPLASLVTRFVAIGATTAAALHEAGIADVAVAATPTAAGIANAVAAVYPPRR
jgi:uroporphyrinogen-III synthase